MQNLIDHTLRCHADKLQRAAEVSWMLAAVIEDLVRLLILVCVCVCVFVCVCKISFCLRQLS